jgi:hypothetical protein
MSPSEKSMVTTGLKRPKLPPPERWPVPDPPKVAVERNEDEKQAGFFFQDDEDQAPQKRRVVFKEKATVPRKRSQRRRKPKNRGSRDLLTSN